MTSDDVERHEPSSDRAAGETPAQRVGLQTPASQPARVLIVAHGNSLRALVKYLEAQGNELVSLEIATPSLEDVFIELTGRRLRD